MASKKQLVVGQRVAVLSWAGVYRVLALDGPRLTVRRESKNGRLYGTQQVTYVGAVIAVK